VDESRLPPIREPSSTADRRKVAEVAAVRRYTKGQIIFEQGTLSRCCIECFDPTAVVDDNDAVDRRIDHRLQVRVGVAKTARVGRDLRVQIVVRLTQRLRGATMARGIPNQDEHDASEQSGCGYQTGKRSASEISRRPTSNES